MTRRIGVAARLFVGLFLALLTTAVATGRHEAAAQSAKELRQQVNANAVTILSGNPNGTYLFIASDIAFVLDDGDELRVLPVVGKGGAQNVRDLIYLRGIDMAIVRSDALQAFSGDPRYRNIGWQLRYITRLYNEEMHILTRKDITSIDQLDGMRVNLSDAGSGTQLTTQIVFAKLGINPIEYNMGQRDGFEKLKAGELDATILVAGKPSGSWKSVEVDRSKFHILSVPWSEPLQDDYLPTKLTHEDYPNILEPGETVDTIAVGAVLASYNWAPDTDRFARIEKFVDAFFDNIGSFDTRARHPKWKEINIAAELQGWTRFGPAQAWLDANRQRVSQAETLKTEFGRFLTENVQANGTLTDKQMELLFRQFIAWRRDNPGDDVTAQTAASN